MDNDLLLFTLFFILWLTFIYIMIYIVKRKGESIFNLNFKEIYKKMPENSENFSARIRSFDFPHNVGVGLPPAMMVNGFYARIYVYENAILIKFFDKAVLITSGKEISILSKSWKLLNLQVGIHSLQFRLSAKHYNTIEKWMNEH